MSASSARLRIVHPGAMASLQDLGRSGLRRPACRVRAPCSRHGCVWQNLLAGNDEHLAAIEFFGGGLQLQADEAPLRVALAGPFSAEIVAADGGRRALDGWRSATLAPGEQLRCGMTRGARVAYVAVAGLAAPTLLGSASTGTGGLRQSARCRRCFLRSACGGSWRADAGGSAGDGRCDRRYDGFAADPHCARAAGRLFRRLGPGGVSRVRVPGDGRVGSHGHAARRHDTGAPSGEGADIASDATVPGSIQVPGNGKPIVLLNDGQTAGGYPKIATVVSADLPRLAALPAGATVRFQAVSVVAAEAAARAAESDLKALAGSIVPAVAAGELDLDALYAGNLLSGMVNATRPD